MKLATIFISFMTFFTMNVYAVDVDDIESISMQVMDESDTESNHAFQILTLPDIASPSGKENSVGNAGLWEAQGLAEAQLVKEQAKAAKKAAKQAAKDAAIDAKEKAKKVSKKIKGDK